MEQYIPKSDLVAEIEKRFDEYSSSILKHYDACTEAIASELDKIVKIYKPDGDFGWGTLYNIATHFFELGLKAQHDNWKVVDNINPPQADRNKIYCVFTKGRYILAKVIDHPKDEESLQWKCTEFPHHRYDMCEGDKYMQIV